MTKKNSKKIIAWGASPIFELYLRNTPDHKIAYCIDVAAMKQGKKIEGVAVFAPEKLKTEDRKNVLVINFGHSSEAIKSINNTLSDLGFLLGDNYLDFCEYQKPDFQKKAEKTFNTKFSQNNYTYARAANFNSVVSLETTVLGNWLLLESLLKTRHLNGSIAEIGAYQGGNSLLLLSAMNLAKDPRNYYILDSFAGFPDFSKEDPVGFQSSYQYDYHLPRIKNLFSIFCQARVVPGFIPGTFQQFDKKEEFSLVFFDCDLYQPALDSYNFFWDRIQKGGILLIHDNIATRNGFRGVRKATEEFFGAKAVKFHDFWETTMSVVFK